MRIKKSSNSKYLKRHRPKKGKFKNAKLFRVYLEHGHQVCGHRIVLAVTGRKWASYLIPISNIRKRMRLSDWNALRAEEIV